jgi:glyoxylase I family protein
MLYEIGHLRRPLLVCSVIALVAMAPEAWQALALMRLAVPVWLHPSPVRRLRPGEQTGGVPVQISGYSHVRLTVTDIDRSRAFYDSVFGLPVAAELPVAADDATREKLAFLFGGVLYRLGDTLLGLRPVATDRFDENRVGLDHLSFAVADRAALHAAVSVLDNCHIAHEPIKDIGSAWLVEFRDPDNIALELFAVKQ